MNIHVKDASSTDRDPFQQSDRTIGLQGKGDLDTRVQDRSEFRRNFDGIRWSPRGTRKLGKQVFRYGPRLTKRSGLRIVVQ